MSDEKVQPQTMADLVNAARRKQEAALSDPAYQEKAKYLWNLAQEIKNTENLLVEWAAKNDGGIPSETAIKEKRIAELRAELSELEMRWNLPPN